MSMSPNERGDGIEKAHYSIHLVGSLMLSTSITLVAGSFAGTNFRDFANSLVVRESLYPRNGSV